MNAEYVCDGGEGITRLIAVGRFDEVWLSQLPRVHSSRYAAALQMDRGGAAVDAELLGELMERLPGVVVGRELIDLGAGQSALYGPFLGV